MVTRHHILITKILEEEENLDDNDDVDDIHDRPPRGGYIFAPVSETKI